MGRIPSSIGGACGKFFLVDFGWLFCKVVILDLSYGKYWGIVLMVQQ